MIKQVRLINWQGYSDQTVDLSPGINVFIGPIDAGKSSVLRAIRWVVEDEPRGDDYRRRGTKSTEVHITLDSGQVIKRIRSSSVNRIHLTHPDGREEVFEHFKAGLPEPITKLLNLSSLNFQSQFDTPFLLQESAGSVARRLNQFAHLELIDSSLSSANSFIRTTGTALTINEQRGNEVAQQLSALPDIDRGWEMYKAMEALYQELVQKEGKIKELTLLLDAISAAEEDRRSLAPRVAAAQILTTAEELGARLSAKNAIKSKLSPVLDQLGNALDGKDFWTPLASLSLSTAENAAGKLDQSRQKLNTLLPHLQFLREKSPWTAARSACLAAASLTIQRAEEVYQQLATAYNKMVPFKRLFGALQSGFFRSETILLDIKRLEDGIRGLGITNCPTCNQKVDDATIIGTV